MFCVKSDADECSTDATVRCAQVLVMSTYYLGQLGIALSALEASA